MKKLIFFTFFALPALCIGQVAANDPISTSTAFSRGNSIGPDNPHFLLNKGEKAIYLSFASHLLSKELKGVKSDVLLSNRLLDAKFSISGYGYKHYKQFEIATSLAKKLSDQLSIGVIFKFRCFNYLGLDKSKNQILPGVSLSYQHSKKHFISHITWLNPFSIASKKFSSNSTENSYLSIGAHILTSRQTKTILEIEWIDQKRIEGKWGFLYQYKDFEIRCGIHLPTFHPCFGLGFRKKSFQLDLSGNYFHPLGVNLNLGIGYQFNTPSK